MQTLRSLAQKSSHSCVFDIIRKHYYKGRTVEDLIGLSLRYRSCTQELISLPDNLGSEYKIYITEKETDKEKFIDVCLYNKKEDELYALDFTDWGDLIDMEIYKAVKMNDNTALAHVLWEITFWGWSDDKVKEERDSILEAESEAIEEIPWDKTPF